MKRLALMLVLSFVALTVISAILALRTSRPNVVLITIDTQRADRLGCYGYAKARTPNIDRLAAEGAVFENAFCDVTWTAPSLSSTMTGQYAVTHGLKSTYQQLRKDNVTLAEVLRQGGYAIGSVELAGRYRTGAVVGSFPASSIFGLGQGFETFDESFTTPIVESGEPLLDVPLEFHTDIAQQRMFQALASRNRGYRPDPAVTDAAVAWLDAHARQPFFLWVHYFGPHEKNDDRIGFFENINRSIAVYDDDVAVADQAVGRLLDVLRDRGLLDHTLVVLHADHGQSLNEHDYFGHGKYLYDEVLRVPLIMRLPGVIAPGKRFAMLARNIDIMPTVLDAADTRSRQTLDGRSLLPILRGTTPAPSDGEMYCETYLSAAEGFATEVLDQGRTLSLGFRRLGIRTPEWTYVRNDPWPFVDVEPPPPIPDDVRARFTTEELYDMAADPKQATNLAAGRPDVLDHFRARLSFYQARERGDGEYRALDADSRERLRALGYVQ